MFMKGPVEYNNLMITVLKKKEVALVKKLEVSSAPGRDLFDYV